MSAFGISIVADCSSTICVESANHSDLRSKFPRAYHAERSRQLLIYTCKRYLARDGCERPSLAFESVGVSLKCSYQFAVRPLTDSFCCASSNDPKFAFAASPMRRAEENLDACYFWRSHQARTILTTPLQLWYVSAFPGDRLWALYSADLIRA